MKKAIVLLGLLFILNCKSHHGCDKYSKAENELKIIAAGLLLYYEMKGHYPENLEALVQEEIIVDFNFMDPWEQKIQYQLNSTQNGFKLLSCGMDKKEGGKGKNQDIIESLDY